MNGTTLTPGVTGPKRASQQAETGLTNMPLSSGETFAGFRIVRLLCE